MGQHWVRLSVSVSVRARARASTRERVSEGESGSEGERCEREIRSDGWNNRAAPTLGSHRLVGSEYDEDMVLSLI